VSGNQNYFVRNKKFHLDQGKRKVMLDVFFDDQSLVHYELTPEGRTVNKETYIIILHHLGDAMRKKCPENGHETAGFSAIFPGSVTAQLFPVSATKKSYKGTAIHKC
jgi:hypothetical protein